jgi:hypothetical protein
MFKCKKPRISAPDCEKNTPMQQGGAYGAPSASLRGLLK